ncbi:MAG: hypothetical protein ABI678_23240 [Kofleriaceae bacterium]
MTTTKNVSDAATGWSFDLIQDAGDKPGPGGLILKNVRHDGHNYARDIRMIGIWLKFELFDPASKQITRLPSRFVTLEAKWFDADVITTIPANPKVKPPADVKMFNYFTAGTALKTRYTSTPDVFAGLKNCRAGRLWLTQLWLFSPYGNTPPHEPTGGLHAARFHPLLRYDLDDSDAYDPSQPYTRVASIRFDYRIHVRIDRASDVMDSGSTTPSNHPGLFRDSDVTPMNPFAGVSGAAFTKLAFTAAEKPVPLEVVAPGLYNGLATKDLLAAQGSPRTLMEMSWDNLHWWGHRKSGHVSAPGAFHAFHMHWRWSVNVAVPSSFTSGVGKTPDPVPNLGNFAPRLPSQLRQEDYLANGTIFGPLVDPDIWTQTLLLAVTKHDATLDPDVVALTKLSTENFQDLFTKRGAPKDIYAGSDCVLWYSTEIPREVVMDIYYPLMDPRSSGPGPTTVHINAQPGGYVFLHGSFFAHDPERTGKFIGDTAELFLRRTLATIQAQAQWYRPAAI